MVSVVSASSPPTGTALAAGLAIFDLDRTLVQGSSLARLARGLAEARLLRRADLVGHLVRDTLFAVRGLGPAATDRLRASLLRAAAGVEQAPLLDVVERVAPAIAADVFPGARWLLERHLNDGHDVIVLSSSPQELVAAVAAALDPSITAIGTLAEVIDGRYTGLLAAPFCHGAGKLQRLEQVLGPRDLAGATAYADAASDLPVLRACGAPIAVNPDRGLSEAATAGGWPIVRFA
jgi:HAD superfamily hydrolase (TIGR01490 family)